MATVSKLQIVLEATTTAFDRGLRSATHTLQGFARQVGQMHDRMDKFARHHRDALQGLQSAGQAAAVGLGVMALGVKNVVGEAVKFESAMAGVKKVVDFPTPEAFKAMEKDIIGLSQKLPMTAEGLAQIMAAAGQSGIAQNELLRFTETAAKMGTAFDITAEQAGQAMAEMRVAFGISQDEVEVLADKINYLGNTSPNAAAEILEVVQRVGSLGEVAGVSSDTIAALSASLTGVAPEVAATSLKNFMLQLGKGESLSTSAKNAFLKMGLDYNEVAKGMQTDSEATVQMVLQAVQKVPEHLRMAALNDAFGSESITAISQLVTNYDTVAEKLQAMGDSSKYAGSMLAEFESMAGTSQAQMQTFSNNITAVKIALGNAFLPTINNVMQSLTPFLQSMADFASNNPELVTTITAVTAGALGLVTVLGGLALAFTAVTSGIGSMVAIGKMIAVIATPIIDAIKFVRMFGAVLAGLGFPVAAVVAGITALVVAGVALYKNWDTVKAKAQEIWFAIGEIVANMVENVTGKFNELKTSVTNRFNEIKTAVKSVFDGLPAPVQTALRVMGNIFNTQFALIKNVVQTVFNTIKALVRGDMQGVANAIRTGLNNAVTIIRSMLGNIVGAFKNLGSQLLQAGRDAIQGFINGVRQKMSEAINIARDMANSVASTVKSALNIRSPSRVMRELGAWAGEGFVLGVSDKVADAKQVAENLASALTSTVQDLHRQNFMLTNHANPLADLDYKLQFGELAELTDAQKSRLLELARINLDIQKANEATAKALQEQEQSAQNILRLNEQSKSNYESLQKQIALFGNQSKVAEFDYDMKNGAFAGVDNALLMNERSALVELERLQTQHSTKTAFNQMQNGLAGENPLAKLQNELNERLRIITEYENAHTGVELEAQQARQQAEQAYLTAKNNLMLDGYANVFGGISGMTKSFFGEQSSIYRAMFAMEKGFAIAKAIIALKANIAEASKIGFPQNIPTIAGAVSQGVAIVNDIRSIAMPVGQAHDGIMSVPKSGTWNLEKGERVLPKHTAQNLDNTLNRLQGRGETKVIINNYTSEKAEVQKNDNGDIMVTIGKVIDAKINQRFMNARRQGGELYGR